MNHEELSTLITTYFTSKDGYCCSEAIYKGLLEYFGVPYTDAEVRIFSPFGGGIGGSGCVCGALTGATAMIGRTFGNMAVSNGKVKVGRVLAFELHKHFMGLHQTTCCKTLTKDFKKEDRKEMKIYCSNLTSEIGVFAAKTIEKYKNSPEDILALLPKKV